MNPRFNKPVTCAPCSLAEIGFGFAPPAGPPSARLVFVGEALGYEEAIWGEPFYGAAGGVLTRVLYRAGINRPDVRIHNVVSCRPPNDYLVGAPWEDHAIACCRQYLDPVLAAVPDNAVVVPLGGTALDAVCRIRGVPGVFVKDWHGTVTRDPTNRYWVVPTFHPSFLQRGSMSLLQIVTEDFRLADKVSQHGFVRSPAQLVVDPTPEWFAAWVTTHLQKARADPDGVHLSLDTEFPEKAGGKDESEVTAWNAQSPIKRVNGANDAGLGWTVLYQGPYIALIEQLLAGLAVIRGWVWLWNKYADWDHLRAAGHTLDGIMAIDGMWLWHYLQSDVFRGLGFVASCYSDFGPWKHWAEVADQEGAYAAADGLQNWRTCMGCLKSAMRVGLWEVFLRDWHDRDEYCLRPAHVMGVPANRVELQNFHASLQDKLAHTLARIKETAARGVLKPKLGYRKAPMKKCVVCQGSGKQVGEGELAFEDGRCATCGGTGKNFAMTPPASILGKPKKGGGEAKLLYMTEGVRLVEAEIEANVTCCTTCGKESVTKTHRCKRLPARSADREHDPDAVVADRPRRRARRADRGSGPVDQASRQPDGSTAASGRSGERLADLRTERRRVTRWFWQLPFNPDAPAQIITYLRDQGIETPVDKKTQRPTTNKKALDDLRKQYKDDPFFQLELDWKAVVKIDSTYAVGTLALLDVDDRVHPEYMPIPSTLRDSARHPNLTNVVADKSGPQSLAAGFRRCIEARDGVPAGVTEAELEAWRQRWT